MELTFEAGSSWAARVELVPARRQLTWISAGASLGSCPWESAVQLGAPRPPHQPGKTPLAGRHSTAQLLCATQLRLTQRKWDFFLWVLVYLKLRFHSSYRLCITDEHFSSLSLLISIDLKCRYSHYVFSIFGSRSWKSNDLYMFRFQLLQVSHGINRFTMPVIPRRTGKMKEIILEFSSITVCVQH